MRTTPGDRAVNIYELPPALSFTHKYIIVPLSSVSAISDLSSSLSFLLTSSYLSSLTNNRDSQDGKATGRERESRGRGERLIGEYEKMAS